MDRWEWGLWERGVDGRIEGQGNWLVCKINEKICYLNKTKKKKTLVLFLSLYNSVNQTFQTGFNSMKKVMHIYYLAAQDKGNSNQ